ncbi:hypothetical protein PS2_005532 [Malus domestica]
MLELRRGVRRGRTRVASKPSDPPPRSRRTRATVAREAAADAVVRPSTRVLKTMRFVIFIEVKIAEKYKEEGGSVDRIGNAFEPQGKWYGDRYEEGCNSKEEANMMENMGN